MLYCNLLLCYIYLFLSCKIIMHNVNKIRQQKRKLPNLPPSANRYSNHYRTFDDNRFVLLDQDNIRELVHLFHHNPFIQNAFKMHYDAALASDIQFERTEYILDEEGHRWHTTNYKEWTLEKERRKKQIGFAIGTARPNPIYGAKPTILNPEKIDIYHYEEPDSTHHIRAFERNTDFVMNKVLNPRTIAQSITAMNGFGESYEQREIHNIEIFWEQYPDSDHGICSVVQTLAEDKIFSEHLVNLTVETNYARGRPPVVTEHVPEKNDKDSVSVMPSSMQFLGNGNEPANQDITAEKRTIAMERKQQMMVDMLKIHNSEDANRWEHLTNYIDNARRSQPDNVFHQEIDLPLNRRLVIPQEPQSPLLLLEFRTAMLECVLNTFSLSLSMLSNAASTGQVKKQTGQSGKGGSGNNSSAKFIFMNAQKALKSVLESDITRMYTKIHLRLLYNQVVKDMRNSAWNEYKTKRTGEIEKLKEQQKLLQPKKQKLEGGNITDFPGGFGGGGGGGGKRGSRMNGIEPDWDTYIIDDEYIDFQNQFKPNSNQIKQKIQVKITIPGIPNDEDLMEWYNLGLLKYDKLVHMLATRHGLDESCFNSKPEVTVKEINGILPPEPKTKA